MTSHPRRGGEAAPSFFFPRAAFALAIALAGLHAVLAWIGVQRDGSWVQGPPTDQCADLRSAILFARAIRAHGLAGFADAWVHHSALHTPVVPAASGILVLLFGESRASAEALLPLCTFVLVLSTLRVVGRFYGARTALATALLTTSFPVFLLYSRTYLFEHPLAAMFAASCWALVASDGLTRVGPALAFGALAGLTSLTRGGAPVYLVGPVAAAFLAHRSRFGARSWLLLALSTGLAIAIAATWYAPNLPRLLEYVRKATYGEEAKLKAGGASAFTLENALYYLRFNVWDGPGLPTLALAVLCWVWTSARARRPLFQPGLLAAGAIAWAITFLLLLVAAQREGARYFQPLMPIVALGIVRAVANTEPRALRAAAGLAVGGIAAAQALYLTFFFPAEPAEFAWGPVRWDVPLWCRSTYHTRLAAGNHIEDLRTDFRVGDAVERAAALRLGAGARVVVAGPVHPFFQLNAFELAFTLHRLDWRVLSAPDPVVNPKETWIADVSAALGSAALVVVRTGGPKIGTSFDLAEAMGTFTEGEEPLLVEALTPLALADGSRVRFLRRPTDAEWTEAPPPSLAKVRVAFARDGAETLGIGAVGYARAASRPARLTLALRGETVGSSLPHFFLHSVDEIDGFSVAIGDWRAGSIAVPPLPPTASRPLPWLVVRLSYASPFPDGRMPPGRYLALGAIEDEPVERRLEITSDLPTDNERTRVFLWELPPPGERSASRPGAPPPPR